MREVTLADRAERFRDDVAAVLGRAVTAVDVLAIAVSGGPDSMALLALAHAAWPGQVIAATVDHGVRAGSADEAAMVAGWCATLPHQVGRPEGISHDILRPAKPLGAANVQAAARAARYALLTDWAIAHGATMLATAHHADDQAETFLMRAARGSGLAGLSGIRPKRDIATHRPHDGYPRGGVVAVYDTWTIPLIRPLLGWRRGELRALVDAAGVPFVDDPSNADERYDRTRFRRLLAENETLDPVGLAQTAGYAREGHEALDAMIRWLWQDRKVARPDIEDCDYQTWLNLAGLPREIERRLAREAIDGVRDVNGITRPAFSSATNIEPLLEAVEAGTAATQGGILVSRDGDVWHFREAPARRNTLPPQS